MFVATAGPRKATVNPDDLPDEIVQPLVELGSALLEHARGHRDQSLAEHEDGVLAAWRAAAPALLEAVFAIGHDWTRAACATDRSTLPDVPAAARGAVTAHPRHADTPGANSADTLVA